MSRSDGAGGGNDIVFDFNPDEDMLAFSRPGIDLAALAATAQTIAVTSTLLTLSDGGTILVRYSTRVNGTWFT